MKKQKKLVIAFLIALLSLIVLYLAVVLPLVNREEPKPDGITVDEGEDVLYNTRLVYEKLDREDIVSITVKNGHGEFSLVRDDPESKRSGFLISYNGEKYTMCDYNEEEISQLIVAAGTVYAREKLFDSEITEDVYREYGLSDADSPAVIEVTSFDGASYRLFVGDATVTDGCYYLRLDGREAVYVSQSTSVGDCAYSKPTKYINPTIATAYTTYGYYYTNDFSIFRRSAELGDTVGSDDTVELSYYTVIDGQKSETVKGLFELPKCKMAMQTALRGRKVGDTGIEFSLSYNNKYTDGELYGKTVLYHVESIDAVRHLNIKLDFLNSSERPMFNSTDVYAIIAPRDKSAYVPDSSAYMGVLESFGELTGTETVALGLTNEKMKEYGLDEYFIYYESPTKVSSVENSDDVIPSGFISDWIYLSKKQQDGSYYAASVNFNIIVKISEDIVGFVDWPFSSWVSDAMMAANIHDVESILFDFNYADAKEDFFFELTEKESNGSTTLASVKQNGKEVNINAFKNLYVGLLNCTYVGDYSGTEPTSDIISDPSRKVMTIEIKLRDGDEHTIEFYPYSARRVLVSLDGGAYFYVPSSRIEKFYNDAKAIENGQTPDYDSIY